VDAALGGAVSLWTVRVLDHNLVDLDPPLSDYQLTITERWLRPSIYELSVPDSLPTLSSLLPATNVHGDTINPGGSTYLVVNGRPYMAADYPSWSSQDRTWTLKGADAAYLDHRLVEHFPAGDGWQVVTGTAAERMHAIVVAQAVDPPVAADKVPHLTAPTPAAAGATGRTEARFQVVSDLLETVGQAGGVGWDVHIDGNQFVWEPVPGDDLTDTVTIDLDLQTALAMGYGHDQRETATRVVLAAQGEGADRTMHVVGGGTGLFRRTTFRDARDVEDSTDVGDTLEVRGLETLTESDPGPAVVVEANPHGQGAVYGVDYRLGDIVTVSNRQVGLNLAARVVEATISPQSGLPDVRVAFDRPFPTLIDRRVRSAPTIARS
jgi:hypothetical protein